MNKAAERFLEIAAAFLVPWGLAEALVWAKTGAEAYFFSFYSVFWLAGVCSLWCFRRWYCRITVRSSVLLKAVVWAWLYWLWSGFWFVFLVL